MEGRAFMGCVMVAILVIGGLFVMRAASRLIFPTRLRLFEMAMDIVQDPKSRGDDRSLAEFFMDSARSFSAGWIIPQALARTLLRIMGREPSAGAGHFDARVTRLIPLFSKSVLVANPLALVVSLPLLCLVIIVSTIKHQRAKPALSVETQRTVSGRMQACHT